MTIAKEDYKSFLPQQLYAQIEEICNSFHELQLEAVGLLDSAKVSDTAAQLNNVLHSTEEATNTILDAASAISTLVGTTNANEEVKRHLGDHVTRIFEACTFQDITGQRIMKVLKRLTVLEEKLSGLAAAAREWVGEQSPAAVAVPEGDKLRQGPALPEDASSQADIDKLFSSLF